MKKILKSFIGSINKSESANTIIEVLIAGLIIVISFLLFLNVFIIQQKNIRSLNAIQTFYTIEEYSLNKKNYIEIKDTMSVLFTPMITNGIVVDKWYNIIDSDTQFVFYKPITQ